MKFKRYGMLLLWTIIMLEYMYIPLYLLDLGMAPIYDLSSTLFKYVQILLPNVKRLLLSYPCTPLVC